MLIKEKVNEEFCDAQTTLIFGGGGLICIHSHKQFSVGWKYQWKHQYQNFRGKNEGQNDFLEKGNILC